MKSIVHIGICKLTIRLPENQSLKGKRRVVKSMCDHLRGHFNVAVAEVDALNLWQTGIIGIVCLGNDRRHINENLSNIIAHISERYAGEFELLDCKQEIISGL